MSNRGRPRKPTRLKVLEGNPGKRPLNAREPCAIGSPEKPEGLSPEASAFWEAVVSGLIQSGVVKAIDSHTLHLLAELWGHMRTCHRLLTDDPTDKVARVAYVAYAAKWAELAARFGLDPSSRSRLQAGTDQPESKLSKYGITG